MDIKFNRENRAVITLTDGTVFEGIVNEYCKQTKVLKVTNITQYPAIEAKPSPKDNVFQLDNVLNMKLIKKYVTRKKETLANETTNSVRKITKAEYFKILNLQRHFRFIDDFSTTFYQAISDLQQSKRIGVCAKDLLLGRMENLSAIAFATENGIYVFDLEELGDKPFVMGIGTVLESNSIVKVTYDCRLLSNCLYYNYGITMNNVRDVKAEDIVVFFNDRGFGGRNFRSFGYLIQLYLGIPGYSVEEGNITEPWSKISRFPKLRTFLANYVSYLIPVHRSIERMHLQKLSDASRMYSEVITIPEDRGYALEDDTFIFHMEVTEVLETKKTTSLNIANS